MDSSSGSDLCDKSGSVSHRSDMDESLDDEAGADDAITEKIGTLASTLQDASENLIKVDSMLCQYREHADDQTEVMARLKESLQESISQLQSQKPSKTNKAVSSSASSLHTSDLDSGSDFSEATRFYPTSPLKKYPDATTKKKRSQSVGVHFKERSRKEGNVHTVHQSLRDLHCCQQRLSDDLDREIIRRNRREIDTRQAMENLAEQMTTTQRHNPVSSSVERRLLELEKEMCAERRNAEKERRPKQQGGASDELQELGRRRRVQAHENEEAVMLQMLEAEKEKSKMELEKTRRLLKKSEDSRDTLAQQVEEMRRELQKMKTEKAGFQTTRPETLQPGAHLHRTHTEEARERSALEKEVAELRAQLCKASVLSEVEELKRALDAKEKETLQLRLQVKELSSDIEAQEQQHVRILDKLRDIQSQSQAERGEMEALLNHSTRSRDELKSRAQDAVHRWRAKCKKMEKELERERASAQLFSTKSTQATKERNNSQSQLKALAQQMEAAHKELGDVLGRLVKRDEDVRRKDVELSESRHKYLRFEQEIQQVRENSAALEQENQRQTAILARLTEENQKLQEQAYSQARGSQREQDAQAELQASLTQMSVAHAQLSQRLVEEENAKKESQKAISELKADLTAVQEERTALSQQLQLERDIHQKELDNMRTSTVGGRMKKDREVQEMLKHYQQDRDGMQAELSKLKANAASDKDLFTALQKKLDRMKEECDKLAAQLSSKEKAHTLLQRKYQLLKQELEDNVRSGNLRHESEVTKLENKVLEMEKEQEAILTSMGDELDAACRNLTHNGEEALQAIFQRPGLVRDPQRWLSENKTKLRWLCEEVRQRDTRQKYLRKQHKQTKDQLKALRRSWDSEQATLLQRLDQQEMLLNSLSSEKKELLDRSLRREEMRSPEDSRLASSSRSPGLDGLSPIKASNSFLSSTLNSDALSSHRLMTTSDLDDSLASGERILTS